MVLIHIVVAVPYEPCDPVTPMMKSKRETRHGGDLVLDL